MSDRAPSPSDDPDLSESEEITDVKPDRKKAIIGIVVAVVVVVIVFGVIFPQLVDWNAVFDALREVDPGELLIIALLAVSRYLPAGWIYSLVLPGLTVRQGTEAWVATTAVSSTLPGFDLVLRVAMYASWGFGLERATSGMFLSGVVEMATKLVIAIVAVTLGALIMSDLGLLAVAAIAALVVLGIAGLIVGILRSEERARSVGERVQRIAHWGFDKFERQAPEDLVDRVLAVRIEAREVLGSRWPQAFLAAFTNQAIVYLMLLLSLRAVGVDSSVLDWSEILFVQGIVILITSIPITPGSLGVAGLAYVGLFTLLAGQDASDLIAAGVILFRLAMWLLPILIGWPVTLRWQAKTGKKLFGGAAA